MNDLVSAILVFGIFILVAPWVIYAMVWVKVMVVGRIKVNVVAFWNIHLHNIAMGRKFGTIQLLSFRVLMIACCCAMAALSGYVVANILHAEKFERWMSIVTRVCIGVVMAALAFCRWGPRGRNIGE